MAGFSGKDGRVKVGGTAVADITKWTAQESAAIDKYGTSSSGGRKTGVAGTIDLKGTIEGKFPNTGNAPFETGDTVALTLASDSGVTPIGSLAGNGIIGSIDYEVDVDTGKAVGFSAAFEGIDAWTKTGVFAPV